MVPHCVLSFACPWHAADPPPSPDPDGGISPGLVPSPGFPGFVGVRAVEVD